MAALCRDARSTEIQGDPAHVTSRRAAKLVAEDEDRAWARAAALARVARRLRLAAAPGPQLCLLLLGHGLLERHGALLLRQQRTEASAARAPAVGHVVARRGAAVRHGERALHRRCERALVRVHSFHGAAIKTERHAGLLQLQPDPRLLTHTVGEEYGRRHAPCQHVDPALGQVVELEGALREIFRPVTYHNQVSGCFSQSWCQRGDLAETVQAWR
eukprot:scaffold110806_cov75-Phaeocystis_antarctica.AAC.2